MTDEEREQQPADDEIEDLDAPEKDPEQVSGGADKRPLVPGRLKFNDTVLKRGQTQEGHVAPSGD
jgi:hypothetical protein